METDNRNMQQKSCATFFSEDGSNKSLTYLYNAHTQRIKTNLAFLVLAEKQLKNVYQSSSWWKNQSHQAEAIKDRQSTNTAIGWILYDYNKNTGLTTTDQGVTAKTAKKQLPSPHQKMHPVWLYSSCQKIFFPKIKKMRLKNLSTKLKF